MGSLQYDGVGDRALDFSRSIQYLLGDGNMSLSLPWSHGILLRLREGRSHGPVIDAWWG